MTPAELHLRIANARTLGAMLRPGCVVPLDLAKRLTGVWEVVKGELHANGLHLEWIGPEGWAVREGMAKPVTLAEVPGAPDWNDPLING